MVKRSEPDLDAVFAALADPTRRSILERLTRGPATVTELSEPYDMSLPAVSKHLRVLESAGLLARQVDGRVHRIELSTGPLGDAMQWLERNQRFWSARLDALAQYLERRPKEEAPWQHPKSPRTPPSASSARSRRRRPKSSRPGRRPTR